MKMSLAWRVLGMCTARDALFFIPVIVAYYGMKGADIAGLLFIQGIFRFGVLLLEVPTGFLADRWSRNNQLVLAGLLWLVGMVMLFLSTSFAGLVMAELIAALACTLRSGTVEAYLHEVLVAEGKEKDSQQWQGRLFAASMLVQSVASVTSGWLFNLWSEGPVVATVICAVLSLWLSVSLPNIPRTSEPRHKNPVKDLWLILHWSLREHPKLPWLLAGPPILFGCTALAYWGTQGRLAQLGVTPQSMGLVLSLFLLLKAGISLVTDHVIARLGGERRLALALPLILVVGVLLIAFGSSMWWVWLGCVLGAGAVHAIGRPYSVCFISREVKDGERATVLSVGNLMTNLVSGGMLLLAEPLLNYMSLGQLMVWYLVVTLLLAGYPLYRLATAR